MKHNKKLNETVKTKAQKHLYILYGVMIVMLVLPVLLLFIFGKK